jgi:predicted ferric reductase
MMLVLRKLLVGLSIFLALAVPTLAIGHMFASVGPATAESAQNASLGRQSVLRLKASWPWYLTRGSGLLAAVSLVLLVLSGVGLLTGYTYRVLEPLLAWTTHRALGIVFLASVIVHMVVLLFDKFAPFTLLDMLIPFVSHYKRVTIGGAHLSSLWVALGVVAFYGVVAVVFSSLRWIDKKPYTWRLLHYLSYGIMAATFFHALFLGTDLKGGTFRVLWVMAGLAVVFSIGLRLWRAWTIGGGRSRR